jgi:hypothetical protein
MEATHPGRATHSEKSRSVHMLSSTAHTVRVCFGCVVKGCSCESWGVNHQTGDLQIEGIIARSLYPVPLKDRNPQDLSAEQARELVRRMRARGALGVKLENQPKQERSIKRQRSIDLRDEDGEDGEGGEDDFTIVSTNPAARGKRTRLGHSPDVEILDLTGD